jgi:hypothetical protein
MEQAASKAGFRMPVATTEKLNGGYYIGRAKLQQLTSGYKENFKSSIDSEKREAISTTTRNAHRPSPEASQGCKTEHRELKKLG